MKALAPTSSEFTAYDMKHMLTYARLVDAAREGHGWQTAAREILMLDVDGDVAAAESCWQSHYDRALWSMGSGLIAAASAGERKLAG